ncbi:hypothetical protein OG936_36800 [Streptomyces sp. NBC_00846]|uniref:hypothetical protein n=1 Tax=Streptomyces sp. NBC_00846 TaxID=2975849 RepID=UPI0038632F3C|nr:hypothetical protein OG936_36800 [Streptomyces sp. NBC_00846]
MPRGGGPVSVTDRPRHPDPDSYEADFADALDQLMHHARTGHATPTAQHLITRTPAKPLSGT